MDGIQKLDHALKFVYLKSMLILMKTDFLIVINNIARHSI